MARAKIHGALSIRTLANLHQLSALNSSPISTSTTPQSSAYPSACPSAYPSDDEMADPDPLAKKPTFPFLSLPSELRTKIYSLIFEPCPTVIDLDPSTFALITRRKLLAIFRVSRQLYYEAGYHFYSTHTFRVFPTYPGKYINTKRPLLARLTPRTRMSITTLELRLGPGWHSPPRGWIVNKALGLIDCQSVRNIKVYVECDPSDGIFKGFRRNDGFYERFSQELLDDILKAIPSVRVVEFDGWSSVKKSGPMVEGLSEIASRHQKLVAWGPERGWGQDGERDHVLTAPKRGTLMVLTRSVAVAA